MRASPPPSERLSRRTTCERVVRPGADDLNPLDKAVTGLPAARTPPWSSEARPAWSRWGRPHPSDGGSGECRADPRAGPRGPGGTASLPYFAVADMALALERVRRLGGSVIHAGEAWSVCRDSEGTPFGLAVSED